MATFEKTMQPQSGVYSWSAERDGNALSVYIGRAGHSGTLCRGVSELLRSPLTSNDHQQPFNTLDTNFIVGTAILYFEKNGWSCLWKHISNDPKDETKYVQSEAPILQKLNGDIKDEFKFRNLKDYWKDKSRSREAENAVFGALRNAIDAL